MPQWGSFCATAAKVSLAFSYQKEWSIATALLNCAWTAGSQEIVKFTLPSFPTSPAGCSCWARAGAANVTQKAEISAMEIKVSRFMLASLEAEWPRDSREPLRRILMRQTTEVK